MAPNLDFQDPYSQTPSAEPKKRSFWQKLGGTSLTISLAVHGILLVIGAVWIFQIVREPEKKVDFMRNSGGGGPVGEKTQVKRQQQMAQPNLARIAAAGLISNITLPEPEEMTAMTSLGGLSTGPLSGGQGGTGTNGGKGDGDGPGVGNGVFAGMSTGSGTKTPFGTINPEQNALVGTFYDLKQTSDRKPTEMTDDEMRKEVREIVGRGFRDSQFRKYFKAPRELFQTKLHIPSIDADAAPAAFECEKEVQPKRWVVTYRGAVVAPKTGKFRFVGAGDDLLVVRLNNRPVFDYGYTLATTGWHAFNRDSALNGSAPDPEVTKDMRRLSPMKLPVTFYKYDSTPGHNKNIGGMAVGPEFEVEAGKTYPIEILIGEIPGGFFCVSLLIEEIGATYEKDPAGFPILPLFRMDNSQPAEMKGQAPPYDPNGPIWKGAPGGPKRDI